MCAIGAWQHSPQIVLPMAQSGFPRRFPARPASLRAVATASRGAPGNSRIAPETHNFEAPLWLNEPLKHVIRSQQFNKESLSRIFEVARECEDIRPGSEASRQLQVPSLAEAASCHARAR